jgi:glycosyltransferase involved in cell wall biosynthesis
MNGWGMVLCKGHGKINLEHVLIVGDFADINGGQAKVAIDSALLLAEAGLSVTFFAAAGPVTSELDHPKIRVVCLNQKTLIDNPSRLNAMVSGLWNDAALRALQSEIGKLELGTSVLHCHGWAKALSPSVGRALASGKVPVLYTMHEYFLACPNGGFFDYRRQEICTRRPLSASCITTNCDSRHLSHKLWRLARGAIAKGPGRLPGGLTDIAYISETQVRAMRPYLPDATRLHALPNPVSVGGARIDASANERFVFVGRLAPEKGGLAFAKAARQLGVPVTFVGDGPEAEAIKAANPEAEITGWLAPGAVQAQLTRARALVFPSLWYEGQPLVPIEALVRGLPVVCGAWTAAAEVVRDGENGVVYTSPTVSALAEGMCRVATLSPFKDDALAETMAPKRHLSRLLEIYQGMLARAN